MTTSGKSPVKNLREKLDTMVIRNKSEEKSTIRIVSITSTVYVKYSCCDEDSILVSDHHHHFMDGFQLKQHNEGHVVVIPRQDFANHSDKIMYSYSFNCANLLCIVIKHEDSDEDTKEVMVAPFEKDEIVNKLYSINDGIITMTLEIPQDQAEKKESEDTLDEQNLNSHEAILFAPGQCTKSNMGIELEMNKLGNTIIKSIPESSKLNNSCLKQGQIISRINGNDCSDLSLEDIKFLIECKSQLARYITIETKSKNVSRTETLKNILVAATGSTMVGVGSVLFFTPLHPVGHAMLLGGGSVLATKFEGPKKLLNKASPRKTFQNVQGRFQNMRKQVSRYRLDQRQKADSVEKIYS